MSQKPSDFLIGINELISILLPGAVAAWALQGPLVSAMSSVGLAPLTGTGGWVAFTVLAYLAGHLIFLLGSLLDGPYDILRQRFLPREKDTAYQTATRIADSLQQADAGAMNTYKFATAVLSLRHGAAAAEVRQFEADSKFFRSLTMLVVLLVIANARSLSAGAWVAALGLVVACLWRYVERRWKATRRAFEYLVTIAALRGLEPERDRNG